MERVMSHKSNLLLWDQDSKPNDNSYEVILWNSYKSSESDEFISIPKFVEENSDYLKSKYLSLIYELGEAKINGKRVIDHLIIRQNFSYWWMTLLAEKCNFIKSPQIDNIIKIMALDLLLKEKCYHKIKIVSINENLAMSVSQLTNKLQIDFEWERIQNIKPKRSLINKLFHMLPNLIQSPIWLTNYLFSNWPLKGVGVKEWRKTNATSTFVSYLFNLVPEATKDGRYESHYWTKLNNLMDDEQHPSNWLHIYVEDKIVPSSKKARNLIQKFNSSQKGHQVHVTLASFLSIPIIWHTLKDWYKVLKLNKLVCKQLKSTSGYLWPLFRKDYQDSMSGIAAISNLLDFNLFEKAMNDLPNQKRGCYLQENIGWEFGFISAWKSAGHQENLIGFPHAAILYWDLRSFFDPRSYKRKDHFDLPLPNYVGMNGDFSKNMYLHGGYPQENLIELESLRYLYLSNFPFQRNQIPEEVPKEKVILVVGDYLKQNTINQLTLLSIALSDVIHSVHIIIKLHPACPINMMDFPKIPFELSTRPIEELLKMSDIVYSGSFTSAAIDAYCVGLPIITFIDGKTLNLSPLRGVKSVYFISDSYGLSSAINALEAGVLDAKENYFFLDQTLPRWQKWLNDDFNKTMNKV